MSHLTPSTSFLQTSGRIEQGPKIDESQWQSPHAASIHILDDNSLLNIFYIYRPAIFDVDEEDDDRILGGKGWDRERWWYKLAQVCQRWRVLILGSASYLGLCLVCTFGTPVVDMLTHSPPLPIVIDYFEGDEYFTGEEDGIIVALEQRDRVRRIRLCLPLSNMRMLIMAIDEEYPVLEYLILAPLLEGNRTGLMLPEAFQAPHLRHLVLLGFTLPIRSRLLATAVGLILLYMDPPINIPPNTLLQWISSMPQLEMLMVASLPVPNQDVKRQLMHSPITTHATLPNLRWFAFQGGSAYLEAVVSRITAPRLERLSIEFFKQLTFFVPRLVQFMNTTEHLRFDSAKFEFSNNDIDVEFYSRKEAEKTALSMHVYCYHLDWQVSSVAQISNSLSQIFSTVEYLTLKHGVHRQSSEEHNEVDRSEWHKLLRSFGNVKTLRIEDGLVKELSCCLQPGDEELPLELLPELQELTYSESGDTGDAFTSFIDARQNAGRPVTLVRPGPRSVTPLSRSSSPSFSDRPT